MSVPYPHVGVGRLRVVGLAGIVGALIFLLPALPAKAAPLRSAAVKHLAVKHLVGVAAAGSSCTMVGTGVILSGSTQIHVENSLNTDTTKPESLTLRSVTGPSMLFRLTTVTTAACRDNPTYPPEETGGPVNFMNGTGAGTFGPDFAHQSPGYSITFEIGDLGDSASADNMKVDVVSFTITNSSGVVVWKGRGNFTSGGEEIQEPSAIAPGSCEPSSSLSVLVKGTNVTSYVPKGSWSDTTTDVSAVNVEGSSITPTRISSPNAVNSCASNPNTGTTVCTSNGTDVYVLNGTTLTATLTDGGSGFADFSGGDCTTCGVAMDATHNRAVISESTTSGPGFQFLDLSTDTFGTPFASPSGNISEDPLIDPIRNLLLSATENNDYELINVANPASPAFFENSGIPISGELDSSGEDCSTGIALAGGEGSDPSQVFIADLSQAKFTPGSPSGTWTAPSQIQTLAESSLSAGASGVAVAQGTHTGLVTGEFGGNALTALALPTTSGSGTPAISDYVTCAIPNTPDGNGWSEGLDPHTVTAYQSPNGGDAIGLFANDGQNWLARVDLTKMLNPADLPRDAAGQACASGTLPSSLVQFIPVP